MANITNKLNSNTGENIQAVTVTQWAPPGATPVTLTGLNEDDYLGGLYNKEGDTYFKWQVAGGFPVSRLTTATEGNFRKLVADFGTAPAIIILDKIIPFTQTFEIPSNIKIEYINGAYFDTPVTTNTNIYVDEQSNTEVTLEQFGGIGDGKVYDGVGSMTAGTVGGNDPYLLEVVGNIFSPQDVGKSICIQNAGIFYEISNQSALTTTIQQYISPTKVKLLNYANYTVSNVRVSFGTDNTNAFYRYNRWARNKEGMVTLNLQKDKKYIHRTVRWGYNVMNQTVNGHGATLLNVAYPWMDRSSLITASGINGDEADGDTQYDHDSVPKYPINTAAANSTSLTLLNTAQSSALHVGEWIMVGSSLMNFDGYPPNYRFFDYVKITSINNSTGQVTIDRALKYEHKTDALWINTSGLPVTYAEGACIYRLEEGSKFGITHIYNDLSFICETRISASATDPVRARGWYVEFNRCNFDNLVPSNAETVVTNHCTQKGMKSEFDKLVTNFVDNGSSWKQLTGGTGIINATFSNSNFDSIEGLSSKNITFNDCTKKGTKTSESFTVGTREGGIQSFKINGGIYNQAPQQNILSSNLHKVVIGSSGISYSGVTLTVPTTMSNVYFLIGITVGTRLDVIANYNSQGGVANGTGNYGIVDNISCDGTTTSITVAFRKTINTNDIVTFYKEPGLVSIKNARIEGTIVKDKKYILLGPEMILENVRVTSNYYTYCNPLAGSAAKIIVNVKKPYTGTTANPLFKIAGAFPQETITQDIYIDVTKKGTREINTVLNKGKIGNDVLPASLKLSNLFCTSVYRLTCSTMAGSNSDLPVVDIYIQNYCEGLEDTVPTVGIETAAEGTNNNTPASTAFVVKNSGRFIPIISTSAPSLVNLNTTYPVATYPVGTQLHFYNIGKVYCRETSTVWSEYPITLTT